MPYQILNWAQSFENERSRQVERCSYVCLPNKFGMSLARLLARDDGAALFGVFVLIVEACSRQRRPRDGWLTEDGTPTGRPWDAEDIAVAIRRPVREVTETLNALCAPKIGWVVERNLQSEDGLQSVEVNEPKTHSGNPHPTHDEATSNPPHKGGREEGREEPPACAENVGGGGLEISDSKVEVGEPTTPSHHPDFSAIVNEFGLANSLGPKNRASLNAMLGVYGSEMVRTAVSEARANQATNPIRYADSVCNRLYAEQMQGRKRPASSTRRNIDGNAKPTKPPPALTLHPAKARTA